MPDTRPLHLIVIDGWHPGLLKQERGKLPAFEYLARAGSLDLDCTSTFPTVTPTALTTLATGAPPSEHGIRGIMWYHRDEDRYVHYWPSQQALMQGTLPRVLRDIFLNLNGDHLNPGTPTLFELLEAAGLTCGNVNFPISRGGYLHPAQLPWFLGWASGLGCELSVTGPRHCYLGDFIRPAGHGRAGFWGRYGINDRRAGDYGAHLIRHHRPDFSLIYLNEHDMRSHHAGPMGCAYSLPIIDEQLGKLMDAYGSWERAVTEARWILVGDHAQSPIGGVPDYAVNVFKALRGLQVVPLTGGGLLAGAGDVAFAPNDRSALVYVRDRHRLDDLLEELATWPSVDQIAWQDGPRIRVWRPVDGAHLSFWPDGPYRDPLGRPWSLSGHLGVLDLSLSQGQIRWNEYPDALGRLQDALWGGADVVITARPGYEFTTGLTMGKGNHGSLAKEDSTVPLLTVGLPPLAKPARTIDVAPAILAAFGLSHPSPYAERRQSWPSSVTG
ncbi:MAG TPA: alkaline phosphatase family protein [Stenomitos sp.]